ncbi:MAG: bactofilin family protein [Candidatus Saccharibacteria bacterium]
MFNGRKSPSFDNIETILAENVYITGQVSSKGSIRIDGEVDGNVDSKGDLIVGERGRVKGNISAHSVLIAGRVEGNITAKSKTEVRPGGLLIGDVDSDTFVVEDGGRFMGHCKMTLDNVKDKKLRERIADRHKEDHTLTVEIKAE